MNHFLDLIRPTIVPSMLHMTVDIQNSQALVHVPIVVIIVHIVVYTKVDLKKSLGHIAVAVMSDLQTLKKDPVSGSDSTKNCS